MVAEFFKITSVLFNKFHSYIVTTVSLCEHNEDLPQRQVSSMLSTKFAPTSTDGQGMSHGWKTTGGPNVWQSGAHKTTNGLGIVQKDVGGMTLKRL